MRLILGGALAVVLVVTAGASADDKAEKIDAKKVVGRWTPKEAPKELKVVFEFAKDGKATASMLADGKEQKMEGTYKVTGNKIAVTMKFGDKEETKTRTVLKLTDTEMVTKDEKGKENTFQRIKDDKKDEK